MSLSSKDLSSIQRAGQAVHAASEAIAATVHAQAGSMVASVASQPFGVESEQAIVRFKTLARLSQGLTAIEAQLQELYAVAAELANPASDVIVLPALSKSKAISNGTVVDVVAKPAKAARKVVVATAKGATRKPAGALTGNDSVLLNYLQGVLKVGSWTSQTGVVMAKGSGLPLGSVGISLRKILASGAVKAGERGMFQLPATSAKAQAVVKSAPAKKIKTAIASKVRQAVARKVRAVRATKSASAAVAAAPAAETAPV